MARQDTGTDDARVRVRANSQGSRPRTKQRPDHADAVDGVVTAIDRGRYHVRLEDATPVLAMKARELGRRPVPDPLTGELPPRSLAVGDRVGVVGDSSGKKDTLARIVRIHPRDTVLRRTAEDSEAQGVERVIVANADQLAIVTALADPQPRPRMIDRCLVAAYDAGMTPILVLTKADLRSPDDLLSAYEAVDVRVAVTSLGDGTDGETEDGPSSAGSEAAGMAGLRDLLTGHRTVLVGHSGVGKSTLVNALVPHADRSVGHINAVTGRGRHTSTSAIALEMPRGGWLIDTPGVRTFGLAHVSADSLLRGFPDLAQVAAEHCPRGCSHAQSAPDCALDEWVEQAQDGSDERRRRGARLASFRRLLTSKDEQEEWEHGER